MPSSETRRILAQLREPTLAVALAALLSQVGDPNRPAPSAADSATPIGKSNARHGCSRICRSSVRHPTPPGRGCSGCWSTTAPPSSSLSIRAIAGPDDAPLAFVRERLAWPTEKLNPPPLIDGSDLIHHGLAPSPEFTRLLEAVRDAQLRGEIETTLGALTLVQRLLDEGIPADTIPKQGLDAPS